MALEFRILGPLAVIDGETPVILEGRRQRALLAILLLHANEVVSADRLIDHLWGDGQPATAANTLQVHVSALRRALGDGSGLVTRAPGYVLEVEPGCLDVLRFERLAAEGADALAAGRCREAASTLRAALGLWHGPALVEFAYEPFSQGDIARVEELRLGALADRIDADLALGRHADVVGELEALVAEHPLRERHRGQLMLALYRSSRQADALALYRDTRRALVEELGVEPGAALRELHDSILSQDPGLAVDVLPHAPPSNLPAAPTQLIGRDAELAELMGALARPEVRLLSLTGPGGTGKTRLALSLAATVAGRFADGVVFVDLAPLADPALVPSSIALALGVKERPGERLPVTLGGHLRERELLLLLDNFERLLDAAPLVAELLSVCPRLRVVATTREPLRVLAEHEYPVPPLRVPGPPPLPDVAALARYESVALFVARSRAVRPDFRLTTENAEAVAEICARLDGLPLAIELAAARSKLLAPAAISKRLEHRLELLTGGARDLPARQRTLASAIDWSHSLLDPDDQRLFARLAVFSGGIDLEAAGAVCDVAGELDVLARLASLVDKSLVRPPVSYDGEPRFAMLETLREYALQRLRSRGEHEAMRRAHAAWYVGLAEAAEPFMAAGPHDAVWIERIEREHDNVRAALAWAAEAGEGDVALRIATAVARFWHLRGHFDEGRRWLADAICAAPDAEPALRARALTGASTLARIQGDYSSAKELLERALEAYGDTGQRGGIGRTLSSLGAIAVGDGDLERARDLQQEGVDLLREVGDDRELAGALDNLADLALNTGDFALAAEVSAEALGLYRRGGSDGAAAVTLFNSALAAMHEGRDDEAHPLVVESLDASKALGDPEGTIYCLEALAALSTRRGAAEQAAHVLGAAEGLARRHGVTLTPFERDLHARTVAALTGALGEERLAAAWAAGAALDLAGAVAFALQA